MTSAAPIPDSSRPHAPRPRGAARRHDEAQRIDRRVLAAIARADALDSGQVDELARELFRHQWRYNPVARDWWDRLGVDAALVRGWRDVPPLPIQAWRSARVASFPPRDAGARPRFLSSGTTGAARSRVYVESLDLYEAALLAGFRRGVAPGRERMRLLFLTPPPEEAPHSSLVHMFAVLCQTLGAPGSAFVAGGDVPAAGALLAVLSRAESDGEPVFLLGPAFAHVHALDALRARGARFRLPRASRLLQTGGFKGRSREIPPGELLEAYEAWLGVPRERVVNEYGMAELASQFYAGWEGTYAGPPWVRWRVLDPLTLAPAPDGVPGALAIWDLANRSSCFALRTEDLAVARAEAFEILGRLPTSEARGCSLDADREWRDAPRRAPRSPVSGTEEAAGCSGATGGATDVGRP
jgi:ribosome modulation factor